MYMCVRAYRALIKNRAKIQKNLHMCKKNCTFAAILYKKPKKWRKIRKKDVTKRSSTAAQ